jgi:hypothetical protein
MDHVLERVRRRFPDEEPDQIRRIVDQVHHQYDGRPIREFIPVLVEREVTDTLHSAQRSGPNQGPLVSKQQLVSH